MADVKETRKWMEGVNLRGSFSDTKLLSQLYGFEERKRLLDRPTPNPPLQPGSHITAQREYRKRVKELDRKIPDDRERRLAFETVREQRDMMKSMDRVFDMLWIPINITNVRETIIENKLLRTNRFFSSPLRRKVWIRIVRGGSGDEMVELLNALTVKQERKYQDEREEEEEEKKGFSESRKRQLRQWIQQLFLTEQVLLIRKTWEHAFEPGTGIEIKLKEKDKVSWSYSLIQFIVEFLEEAIRVAGRGNSVSITDVARHQKQLKALKPFRHSQNDHFYVDASKIDDIECKFIVRHIYFKRLYQNSESRQSDHQQCERYLTVNHPLTVNHVRTRDSTYIRASPFTDPSAMSRHNSFDNRLDEWCTRAHERIGQFRVFRKEEKVMCDTMSIKDGEYQGTCWSPVHIQYTLAMLRYLKFRISPKNKAPRFRVWFQKGETIVNTSDDKRSQWWTGLNRIQLALMEAKTTDKNELDKVDPRINVLISLLDMGSYNNQAIAAASLNYDINLTPSFTSNLQRQYNDIHDSMVSLAIRFAFRMACYRETGAAMSREALFRSEEASLRADEITYHTHEQKHWKMEFDIIRNRSCGKNNNTVVVQFKNWFRHQMKLRTAIRKFLSEIALFYYKYAFADLLNPLIETGSALDGTKYFEEAVTLLIDSIDRNILQPLSSAADSHERILQPEVKSEKNLKRRYGDEEKKEEGELEEGESVGIFQPNQPRVMLNESDSLVDEERKQQWDEIMRLTKDKRELTSRLGNVNLSASEREAITSQMLVTQKNLAEIRSKRRKAGLERKRREKEKTRPPQKQTKRTFPLRSEFSKPEIDIFVETHQRESMERSGLWLLFKPFVLDVLLYSKNIKNSFVKKTSVSCAIGILRHTFSAITDRLFREWNDSLSDPSIRQCSTQITERCALTRRHPATVLFNVETIQRLVWKENILSAQSAIKDLIFPSNEDASFFHPWFQLLHLTTKAFWLMSHDILVPHKELGSIDYATAINFSIARETRKILYDTKSV